MDDIKEIKEIDFEEIPEEVIDFLISEKYKIEKEELIKNLNLNEEQESTFEYILLELMTNSISSIEFDSKLSEIITDQNIQNGVKNIIDEKFLFPIYQIVENSLKKEEFDDLLDTEVNSFLEKPQDDLIENTPIVIDNIANKFNKPVFIVPTKRDYSLEKTIPTLDTGIKSIDPYREIPRDDK